MGKGKAEAIVVGRINNIIYKHDPNERLETNAKLHMGMNSQWIAMRVELHKLAYINTRARKVAIRKRIVDDFLDDQNQLAKVGLAFINTHP